MSNEIKKTIELEAPVDRVWRALTDAKEFGSWFGVTIDQPFAAGAESTGRFNHSDDFRWTAKVDRIEPQSFFSYFWHPYAVKPDIDYAAEEPTLVAFALEPIASGTQLTITESGFDRVPAYRREEALAMNTRGWGIQADRIKAYVEG